MSPNGNGLSRFEYWVDIFNVNVTKKKKKKKVHVNGFSFILAQSIIYKKKVNKRTLTKRSYYLFHSKNGTSI